MFFFIVFIRYYKFGEKIWSFYKVREKVTYRFNSLFFIFFGRVVLFIVILFKVLKGVGDRLGKVDYFC